VEEQEGTQEPQQAPLPGVAGMAQGQPAAGVSPRHAAPAEAEPETGGLPEDGVGVPPEDQPEQPDKLATGGEALEEQQQNPELDDNSGTRP
jgi:hypothetical protein